MCSCLSSTPQCSAASKALSGTGSQAPKTMSLSSVRGTNSLISGARLSVRLPRRIVAIWVREPIGFDFPCRINSTPAMKVVATAPSPTLSTPSFPVAGFTARAAVFCPTLDSFVIWSPGAKCAAWRSGRLGALGLLVHPEESLHHRDQREQRQDEEERREDDPPRPHPQEERRRPDPEDPLGPLRDPHLSVEPQPLRTRARVRHQQRGEHPDHAEDH